MSPKLIFLDIDGTLTMPGSNEPPQSALEAIRAAQRKGNLVFLCSGRNPGMLEPLLKYGFDGVIACAGGYVTVGDELIYDMPMAGEEMELAVEKLHAEGVFCTIECRDGAFGDENLGAFLDKHAGEDGKGNSEIERWRKALASSLHIRPISEYDGTPAYKVVIMCLHPGPRDRAGLRSSRRSDLRRLWLRRQHERPGDDTDRRNQRMHGQWSGSSQEDQRCRVPFSRGRRSGKGFRAAGAGLMEWSEKRPFGDM